MSMRLIKLTTPLIVLSLLVLAASAWLSLQNTRGLIAAEGWVQHTQQVLGELQNVLADANGAVAAERGYLLAPDPELLVPYDRSKQDATDAVGRLLPLTADNPGENARVARLQASLQETFALLDRGVALPKAGIPGTVALAENVVAGRLAIRDIRNQIAELEAEENRLLAVRTQATSGSYRRAVLTLARRTVRLSRCQPPQHRPIVPRRRSPPHRLTSTVAHAATSRGGPNGSRRRRRARAAARSRAAASTGTAASATGEAAATGPPTAAASLTSPPPRAVGAAARTSRCAPPSAAAPSSPCATATQPSGSSDPSAAIVPGPVRTSGSR